MELEYGVQIDDVIRAQFAFFNDAVNYMADQKTYFGHGTVMRILNDKGAIEQEEIA